MPNKGMIVCCCLLWAVIGFGAEKPAPDEGLPVWTSRTGTEIRAKFVELQWQSVVLETADGKQLKIRLNQLSPEDQVRANELARAGGESGGDEGEDGEPSLAFLPVFETGPHKGYYAVYEHPNVTARIDAQGRVTFQPMAAGKPVGKPFTVYYGFGYRYKHPSGRTLGKGRRVVTLTKAPPPSVNPVAIKLEGVLEDDVRFEFEYTFEARTVCMAGRPIDPKGLEHPTRHGMGSRLPASHAIPPGMPLDERQELLEGCTMKIKPPSGGTVEYSFFESLKLNTGAQRIEVAGAWAPRTVVFEAQLKKGAGFKISNYSGQPLWKGYNLGHSLHPGSSASSLCISFE